MMLKPGVLQIYLLCFLLLCGRPSLGFIGSSNPMTAVRISQGSIVRKLSTTTTTTIRAVPSLIVFDLDNTLWTPELYMLRDVRRNKQYPVANEDVKLFPAVGDVLDLIQNSETFANTKVAIASRTKSGEWAHDLLEQFGIKDQFDYIEIFPGDKKKHFSNLKEQSGIEYEDMLFFDDSRDGKFGNCEPVSSLGVLSVHCPKGIYEESVWTNALQQYSNWSDNKKPPNTIVEWDGTITASEKKERLKGTVKYLNREKRFGFIQYGNFKDMFFHFNALPNNQEVEDGDELSFIVITNHRNGKNQASNIEIISSGANTINMKVFSMNLPFAALLSNGYKILETRNGTMFTPFEEGTKMLLQVGQRIYPDSDRHMDVMKSGGLDDDEIQKLKSLPPGFTKGMAVAIVELGKTYETTLEERCDPDFQRSVGAFGADSGMRATEIKRVEYLKRGVKVAGRSGVFQANISKDVIPDGWL